MDLQSPTRRNFVTALLVLALTAAAALLPLLVPASPSAPGLRVAGGPWVDPCGKA